MRENSSLLLSAAKCPGEIVTFLGIVAKEKGGELYWPSLFVVSNQSGGCGRQKESKCMYVCSKFG